MKRHDYLPFGEELPAGVGGRTTAQGYSGDNVRQKFTSQERDNETGLDYFGARYFSSLHGRFTSPDEPTLDQWPGGPQSWNLYSFVRNNPLNLIDPSGNTAQDPCPECKPIPREEAEEWKQQVANGDIPNATTSVFACGSCGNSGSSNNWLGNALGLLPPKVGSFVFRESWEEPDYEHDIRYAHDPDDFKQLAIGIGKRGISLDIAITRTRRGAWFFSAGGSLSFSPSPVTASLLTGQTYGSNGNQVRDERSVNAILEGQSFNGQACGIFCLGLSANTSPLGYIFNAPHFTGGGTTTAGIGVPTIGIGKQKTIRIW